MTSKVEIPLYSGDDFVRMSELRREVSIAQRVVDTEDLERLARNKAPARVGDDESDGPSDAQVALKAAQDAFDSFVDEASERAELWVLNPIGHEEFRGLLLAHPPRKVTEGEKEVTHPDDQYVEVDTTTFPKALLEFIDSDDDDIRTIVEPEFDTVAAMRKRVKRLSSGEFDSLWHAAYQLNNGAIADPKSLRFSPAALRLSAT